MNVALVHDQVPPDAPRDQADALVQADAVAGVLRTLGHTCWTLPITLDLGAAADALRRRRPDVVFNLVEAPAGQGRLIHLAPALFDAIGIPYTGARTAAMFLTSNKLLTKQWLHARGIPTPAWLSLRESSPLLRSTGGAGTATEGGPVPPPFPTRCILKSVWEDASVGLDDDAVLDAVDADQVRVELQARAGRLGGEAFAEQYIDGREFNLAMLARANEPARAGGPQVLPPAEIEFRDYPAGKPRIVGYAAKWDEHSFEYRATPQRFDFPDRDRALLESLRSIAIACWNLFGLNGYARVDFRVDEAGRPWVLEVNPNPCLSPDAGFPAAARQVGMTFEQVIQRILDAALARGC